MGAKARMPRQPGAHGRGLVGAVVVHHQIHLQGGRDIGVDGAQKSEEFSIAAATMQLADHLAASDIAHFLDEQRIGRELEGLDPVGLQPKRTPDPSHRAGKSHLRYGNRFT